ncbi:MAG: hypothetical protein K940chlam2_01446 [Chlamydiae bacterium]|nr:hypothetical protein [Chlamydiota bacterium]
MDRFSQILYDLGQVLEEPLYIDENRVCQLNYKDELDLQIQFEEGKEQLLIGIFLCEVPPGKYREKLLKEALMTNGEYPRLGTLAYSERNNMLTFFELLPAAGLTGEKLFEWLEKFVERGKEWKAAVESGNPLPSPKSSNGSGGMLGIK